MTDSFQPLNRRISEVLTETARSVPSEGLTIRDLLHRLGNNGLLILSMVLTIPFLLPVSIPGSSTPFGLLIALIGSNLLRNRSPRLPDVLMQRRISSVHLRMILERGIRFFRRIEQWTFPRLPILTQSKAMRNLNGGLLVLGGILLMAPLPLPLSNTIPAYGVLFLATGSLERDGYLLIVGYAMILLAILYFSLVAIFGTVTFQTFLPE